MEMEYINQIYTHGLLFSVCIVLFKSTDLITKHNHSTVSNQYKMF